jgi:hypothetical protein
VYHQVLPHPSEHGTGSMGYHMLATAYSTKLHKLSSLEVTDFTISMLNKAALARMMRKEGGGSTIASLDTKFTCDISVISILTELTGKALVTGT